MSEEKDDLLKDLEKVESEEDTTVWDYENRYEDYPLFKKNRESKVWWVDIRDQDGMFIFTLDKKKFFYLYRDYSKMLKEEKEVFDKSEPFWANFFNG